MENPEIRILLELRRELDEQLAELRDKVERLQEYIQVLDSMIGSSSFATADSAIAPTQAAPSATTSPVIEAGEARSVSVMNKARELELATIETDGQSLTVHPASHAIYDIKRGAFARFFVERILGKFQEEDRHRVENGEIEWEQAFDFEVRAEDGILQEVTIRNFGNEDRFGEIQRALRWALEKTYRAR
ncbi:MAG: hypothetical protein ACE5H4_00320 [Candidatus Thorarchaeota archaeon]